MNGAIDRRTFTTLTCGALLSSALAGCGSQTTSLDAAGFTAARRFAQTRFGDIAYVERGIGPSTSTAALFLHGFPLNGFQWRGALERLAPLRRCIAPDFLGLGHTRVASGQSVAPQAQVDMLVALLDALSAESVEIVANDSGGAIAQLLATQHAARVRTLLLTNCDTERDSPPAALQPVIALSKQGKFVDEWLAPWRADPVLARSAQGIGGMCYTDPAHPTNAALEMYLAPLLHSPRSHDLVHAYAAALERNPLVGITPALRRSRIPTRVLWGTADTIFAPTAPEQLARSLGNSRGLRRLEGRKLFWPSGGCRSHATVELRKQCRVVLSYLFDWRPVHLSGRDRFRQVSCRHLAIITRTAPLSNGRAEVCSARASKHLGGSPLSTGQQRHYRL